MSRSKPSSAGTAGAGGAAWQLRAGQWPGLVSGQVECRRATPQGLAWNKKNSLSSDLIEGREMDVGRHGRQHHLADRGLARCEKDGESWMHRQRTSRPESAAECQVCGPVLSPDCK